MESQVSNNNTSKKQKLESQLYQIQNQLQELRIQQQELLSNQKQSKYQSKKKSSNNTYNATMNSNASTSVKLPSPNKNDLNIKKFYHPNIEYVISELSMSPYLTRPSAGVKHQKIKCLEKIREYKFNGMKFSDIPLDKLPYQVNVEKMKDEFVNKIMSFNKNDAYTKELRSPTRPTTVSSSISHDRNIYSYLYCYRLKTQKLLNFLNAAQTRKLNRLIRRNFQSLYQLDSIMKVFQL